MDRRPAVFIDRDGTLNELVGYLNHISAFRLFPWAAEAVRLIRQSGFLAVLVTNQSGVARGLYTEELVHAVHDRMQEALREAETRLDGIYYCPHGPSDQCGCRKPSPGMLLAAENEMGIDLSRSWVIGDSYSDLEMAWNTGARGALVLTGYGRGGLENHGYEWSRQPDIISPNLFFAAMNIIWETNA
jgi:D-glycero-D-manno-heptose 1,7-bisphosphate phosphatase